MSKLKIHLLSDTHGFHTYAKIPEDTDLVIHAGDASNYRQPSINANELMNFFEWYKTQPFQKIFVPGNHDTSLEHNYFRNYDFGDIIILDHKAIVIDGIKIFGSPYTPTFGEGWAYNKRRDKLHPIWQDIPLDIDILVTHGPPKGILDLSTNPYGNIEYCGCLSLTKRVQIVQPKYHIFGHVHDSEGNFNHGTRTIHNCYTTFINASQVVDGRFDMGLVHQGINIEI